MRSPEHHEFRTRYEALLRNYLANPAEVSLEGAYEMGRSASAAGIGILEVTAIHVEVMQDLFPKAVASRETVSGFYASAQAFLMECLAPYELAYRGFRDANARLRELIKREEFLSNASWRFSLSLDQEETIREIVSLAVSGFAFGCMVEVADHVPEHHTLYALTGDMDPNSIIVSRHKPEGRSCLQAVSSSELDEARRNALMAATGKRFLPDDVWKFLPLNTHRAHLGIIVFVLRRSVEESLIHEFVARASTALDNARLYGESEDAIRAREDILNIVAHDLRNPLSSIKLNTEMIGRLMQVNPDGARIRSQTEMIKRGIKRIEVLVEDILDLARIEAGTLQINTSPCRVGTLIEDALIMMRPIAEKKGIQLDSQVLCADETIECDSNRILQVFSNLVGNAVKFTRSGGSITVRAKSMEQMVLFSVLDSGDGIPPDQLPHIFDRLWQARPGGHAGIGFGLYISRMIVQAHGGAICPDSTPGKGSSFFFTLPISQAGRVREAKVS